MLPELTFALIGEISAIDVGPSNLLLDKKVSEYSEELYNLSGRVISVTNMLGLQSIESLHLTDTIHSFLLLIPYSPNFSHYHRLGLQWLEKNFGEDSLKYLMTVVTYKSDEKCENALTDLNVGGPFEEKRYHQCLRSMSNAGEILELLEKIDGMASENDHSCYRGSMKDKDKEQISNVDSQYFNDKKNSAGTFVYLGNHYS